MTILLPDRRVWTVYGLSRLYWMAILWDMLVEESCLSIVLATEEGRILSY